MTMSVLKKAKVVMLPTQKASVIQKWGNWLFYDKDKKLSGREPKAIYQDLYTIDDSEIKEGDWAYDKVLNKIIQVKNEEHANFFKKYKKVIATTNNSIYPNCDEKCAKNECVCLFPKPSPQFIDKYIECFNKGEIISEVQVQYEVDVNDKRNWYVDSPSGKYWEDEPIPPSKDNLYSNPKYFKLKVDKNNFITIKPIKNSFSREEVIAYGKLAFEVGRNFQLTGENNLLEIEQNL